MWLLHILTIDVESWTKIAITGYVEMDIKQGNGYQKMKFPYRDTFGKTYREEQFSIRMQK